jgi:hypothetical protein
MKLYCVACYYDGYEAPAGIFLTREGAEAYVASRPQTIGDWEILEYDADVPKE